MIGGGADVEARLVPAACGVVEHGHPTALHKRTRRKADRLKGAEEHQGQLLVPARVQGLARGTNGAVEEELGPGVPHEAFPAEVHVGSGVELLDRDCIVRKGSH